VVLDDNYPPYVFRDEEGNLQGILVDEWALFGRRTGVRVELRGMNWGDALERMARGDFDVIDTMFRNPQREKSFDFSEPYARIDVPLFFRKELSGIRDASSLGNLRVAVKRGDNAILFLRERGATNLAEYDSYEEIVRAAVSGDETVFVTDEPPALFFLYRLRARDLFRRTRTLYAGEFHRAVRKGDRATLRLLERGFRAISPEEYGEIRDRWIGEPLLSPEAERMIRIGLPLAGAVLLSLLLGMWGLRRMVRIRTAELNVQMALAEERAEALRRARSATGRSSSPPGTGSFSSGRTAGSWTATAGWRSSFGCPGISSWAPIPGSSPRTSSPTGNFPRECPKGTSAGRAGGFPSSFPGATGGATGPSSTARST
jgi:ABC-type amino acid transport substrate-binding protein